MSAESNAVRALADSGTPGPWAQDNSVWAWIIGADEAVVARLPLDADATKIVAAVNALPKVADLIEAVDARRAELAQLCPDPTPKPGCDCSDCHILAACDALTAALGVTE